MCFFLLMMLKIVFAVASGWFQLWRTSGSLQLVSTCLRSADSFLTVVTFKIKSNKSWSIIWLNPISLNLWSMKTVSVFPLWWSSYTESHTDRKYPLQNKGRQSDNNSIICDIKMMWWCWHTIFNTAHTHYYNMFKCLTSDDI